jgi:lipopolysaccharide transport system ATP-binding protein
LLEVGTGFHPELSGRENIFLNGAILGMTRAEIRQKFDEIVAFAEIERFLDTPVKRYSSGMYVRLAFAVAAHLEPEILIIDEVLAVGDAQFQKKCLGKMEDVSKNSGRTVLFVSHNMQTINNFCDYSILLNGGRIINSGRTEEITALYLNQFREFNSHKNWEPEEKSGPGVWLKRLEVVDSYGNDKEKFLMKEDIYIRVTFEVLADAQTICHSIAVFSSEDVIAFITMSSSDPFYKKPFNRGTYSAVCRIPGNLLNSGNYWLFTNIADEHHKVLVETDKEVSFEVFDDGLERAGYFGPWLGLLRPKLEWTTQMQNPVEVIKSSE